MPHDFINCLKGKNLFLKLHPRDSILLNPCTAVGSPGSGGSLGVMGSLWEGRCEQVGRLIESTPRAFPSIHRPSWTVRRGQALSQEQWSMPSLYLTPSPDGFVATSRLGRARAWG